MQYLRCPDIIPSVKKTNRKEDTTMKFYDQINARIPENIEKKRAFIVGGGIAGLAAAVYLIQDAHMPASNITLYEAKDNYGGALEAFGTAKEGYLSPGAREPEPYFQCMWDLCRRIPSLEEPERTVLDETVEFNRQYPIFCNVRFLEKLGNIDETQHDLQLDPESGMRLMQLLFTPDESLANVTLRDWFPDTYFVSNMWQDFRTKLAFQEWDSALEMKLYVHRFLHLGEGTEEHRGILHFKYDEFDSLVKPILVYLEKQGVHFYSGTEVVDFELIERNGKIAVSAIHLNCHRKSDTVSLTENDYVFFTSGSMVQNTSYGDNEHIAVENHDKVHRGCFSVWEKLALHDSKFGHPEKFISNIDKTKWLSFCLTVEDYPKLIQSLEKMTQDKDGCAGLITIKDSSWLLSTYVQHQPFFPGQPENTQFIWNYGLHPWNTGDYINKPMCECTGNEIIEEWLYHLGMADKIKEILPHCRIRTAMMPYITSQFMPRQAGDRPPVIPEGYSNLALMGQYVETGDVVFTVETSIRSAMIGVYGLLNLDKPVIPIAPTKYDIRVIASMARMTTGNGEAIPEFPLMTNEQLKELMQSVPAFTADI